MRRVRLVIALIKGNVSDIKRKRLKDVTDDTINENVGYVDAR